jgi:hypothetical protein
MVVYARGFFLPSLYNMFLAFKLVVELTVFRGQWRKAAQWVNTIKWNRATHVDALSDRLTPSSLKVAISAQTSVFLHLELYRSI